MAIYRISTSELSNLGGKHSLGIINSSYQAKKCHVIAFKQTLQLFYQIVNALMSLYTYIRLNIPYYRA